MYGVCHGVGMLFIYHIFRYWFLEQLDMTLEAWNYIMFGGVIAVVSGGRFMCYLQGDIAFCDIHKIYNGGLSIFGDYYAGLLYCLLVAYIGGYDAVLFIESVMLSTSFQPLFGRLGNYFNGELNGLYSEYLNRAHPSQIYQMVSEGVVMSGVLWYFRYTLGSGFILVTMPSLYAVVRFICEFFKQEDIGRPLWYSWRLRWSQFQCLCLPVVFGVVYKIVRWI